MGGGGFLTDTLTIFAVVTNYLQTSPRSCIFIFILKVAKWNRYIYKGPPDKFLFLHEALCNIQNPFTAVICVFCVIHLETWASTQPK